MYISKDVKQELRLMRRDIKNQYKTEKMRLKQRCRWEIERFSELCGIPRPKDPPKRSVTEEIGNAVSHGFGAILSFVALVIMLEHSVSMPQRVGAVIYFFGLFVVFSSSCVYHALRHGSRAKRIFRRFDYASVYVLIGATFCPILLNFSLPHTNVALVLWVQWAVITVGIAAALVIGPERFIYPHISLYLILGWSALLILPSIGHSNGAFFRTILGGGILYTVGVIPCAIDRRAAHFIWHLFVLAGAAVQCGGVLEYIYMR